MPLCWNTANILETSFGLNYGLNHIKIDTTLYSHSVFKQNYNCQHITCNFLVFLLSIGCKLIFATAGPVTKQKAFSTMFDMCQSVSEIHGHVCSHFAPSNINDFKQTIPLLDSVLPFQIDAVWLLFLLHPFIFHKCIFKLKNTKIPISWWASFAAS